MILAITHAAVRRDAALEILQKKGLDIPFIIVSGSIGEEMRFEAMKQGPQIIYKDRLARLGRAVVTP